MKKILLLAMVIGVLIAFGIAFADSERCDGGIVSTGDPIDKVLEKCGNPKRAYDLLNGYGIIVGQELVYDFGPNQMIRYFRFRNGRLAVIRTDSR